MKKAVWLDKKVNLAECRSLKHLLRNLGLNTVCEQSRCPNISECFSSGVATFMILGNTCTRNCSFCAISRGKPKAPDLNEPERIKEAVKRLGLSYVVITSPTRDDLKDGGAKSFCLTVRQIKSIDVKKKVEILIPDFRGNVRAIEKLACCGPEVIAHNIETVPSLYIKVRKQADYNRSLEVLRLIKEKNRKVFTKSSLMLGLGEETREVIKVLIDLRRANCDFLTLGQYLRPSLSHERLQNYIHPDKFSYFKEYALSLGFLRVSSSPYARSSYLAHTFLK